MNSRLRISGASIAAKLSVRPIGYRRNGSPVWPIAGGQAPTLVGADNFTHRYFGNDTSLPTEADRRVWASVARTAGFTYDTTYTRDGRGYMKVVEDGVSATNAQKGIPSGNRIISSSFYVVIPSAPTTDDSRFWMTQGPANNAKLVIGTNGTIRGNIVTNGPDGPNICDGAVHRIDVRFVCSGTTFTLDFAVDGTAQTQVTATGQTAADLTTMVIGSLTANHNLTFWIQDVVWSFTSGDHPIGAHFVRSLYPNGDGTHNVDADGDMHFPATGGTPVRNATTAWTAIDDWITGAADTTTYVQDTAGASTEYSEHTFDNTSGSPIIWGVFGYAALFASGTTLCRLTVRIVDSTGATLTDIAANEDVSETTLRYWAIKITGPGGSWDSTELDGAKVRIGLSTDVNPDPRCSAVMLQYVVGMASTLTINDATHGHTADNIALTQVHSLAVQDAVHFQSSDNIALTQVHQLAIQDALHGHTAENVVLQLVTNLLVQDAQHGHTADSLALTQIHILVIQDSLHGHSADNIVLTQVHQLTIQDALHSHAAENILLVVDLAIQDAQHSQVADNLDLTQVHSLAVQDALHSHAADNVGLTQIHQLVIQEALHGHIADNLVLTQIHQLAVNDATHGHIADQLVLTQVHILIVADALHSHAAENVVLSTETIIPIHDALHTHAADQLTLTQIHVLVVQEALHAHTVESPSLTQIHQLNVQESLHGHTADNILLAQIHNLIVGDTLHGHAAEQILLSQIHQLAIAEAFHAHSADGILLAQLHLLTIQDAFHSHLVDNLLLSQIHELVVHETSHSHLSENVVFFFGESLQIQKAIHVHLSDQLVLQYILLEGPFSMDIVPSSPKSRMVESKKGGLIEAGAKGDMR